MARTWNKSNVYVTDVNMDKTKKRLMKGETEREQERKTERKSTTRLDLAV